MFQEARPHSLTPQKAAGIMIVAAMQWKSAKNQCLNLGRKAAMPDVGFWIPPLQKQGRLIRALTMLIDILYYIGTMISRSDRYFQKDVGLKMRCAWHEGPTSF